jgi:hypothetical protein
MGADVMTLMQPQATDIDPLVTASRSQVAVTSHTSAPRPCVVADA